MQFLSATSEIDVTALDGTRLHGWIRHTVEDADSKGLVIYFGGNAEEVSGQMFDAQLLAPWSIAAFNYRGYGRSAGRPSEEALVADAITIYDRITKRQDVDPSRIVVLGRSLGSGVAVQLAASRPVQAVMLVSPFDSLRSIARKQYPIVPVSLLLKHPFDSLALAPEIEAPLLVIAGERDDLIRPGSRNGCTTRGPARRDGPSFRTRITTTFTRAPDTGPRSANFSRRTPQCSERGPAM